jgi:hypothetical protein
MEIFKKYKVLLVLALVVIVGVFLFFSRMYHNDIKALEGFLASYETYDKVISDFSISKTDDLESKAGDALIELNTKATFRLSSLIKNDAELMDQALEAADLARRELESLKIYRSGIQSQNADLDGLAEECRVLTGKRKASFARFQGLSGTH